MPFSRILAISKVLSSLTVENFFPSHSLSSALKTPSGRSLELGVSSAAPASTSGSGSSSSSVSFSEPLAFLIVKRFFLATFPLVERVAMILQYSSGLNA